MKFPLRRILVCLLLILIALVFSLWWNRPRRVDMAEYAPADSLIYLECNDLPLVGNTITQTDTWKEMVSKVGLQTRGLASRWALLAATLGIGPTENVILSRAQVAVVMLDMNAAEDNQTLRIRPEGAVIIETHTAHWRITPIVESALQRFAQKTYGLITPSRYREDADYLEWSSPNSNRQIVAAIDQSLVVVGNSKRAVKMCLEARHGQRPSLRADSALQQMRLRLNKSQALTFGYISSSHATRLFSWAAPLLLGRDPGDSTLAKMITKSATKVLGAVGWSCQAANGGIEDRFFFMVEPSVLSRLQPIFKKGTSTGRFWSAVPAGFDSLTVYTPESPTAAWDALRSVFSQFDTLSAVVFVSVLKAALTPYGIENPDQFLKAVGPEVATVKLQRDIEGSILIARALDRAALERMFRMPNLAHSKTTSEMQVLRISEKNFAATFIDDYFVIGDPKDVRICLEARRNGQTITDPKLFTPLEKFSPQSNASIITYADDSERALGFLSTIFALQGRSPAASSMTLDKGNSLFARTETTLVEQGIERTTRSPFGQFSTFTSLLRND